MSDKLQFVVDLRKSLLCSQEICDKLELDRDAFRFDRSALLKEACFDDVDKLQFVGHFQ